MDIAQVGFLIGFAVIVYFIYKAVMKSRSKPNVRK